MRGRGSQAGRPLLWLLPASLVLAGLYLIPLLDVMRLAFTDATLLEPMERVTTDAVRAMLTSPVLGQVLWTTALFTGASVAGLQLAGLGIALLVHRGERRGLPGMMALRTLVLTAWVIPGIANGLIWQMLFSEAPFGALNSALRLIGIAPVAWLSDPGMALVSAVIANIWQGTAFSMIVFFAALKSVDRTLYEAAAVDGATQLDRFFFITLPQLRGAILVNTVLVTIQTLNTFDAILALTGGGPGRATEVLSLFTFNTVFYNFDLAGGSVLALLLLAISIVLAGVYIAALGRRADRQ